MNHKPLTRSKSNGTSRTVRTSPWPILELAVCVCALALCQPSFAQAHLRPNSERRDPDLRRAPESSELASENDSRAAASAAQIKTVLAKDAGLMVELKRWVAEEATGNGQVVEDADLSDGYILACQSIALTSEVSVSY